MIRLLDILTADEVAQVLELSRANRQRFAYVAERMLATADDRGIPDHIARLSVSCECLLLSAYFYTGERDDFIRSAHAALDRKWA
jgi:hypothetical protein